MEFSLRDIVWPVRVIQCRGAVARIESGEDLTITVSDSDMVHHIVFPINSRPDFQFEQCRKPDSFQLNRHPLVTNQRTGMGSIKKTTDKRALQGGEFRWN
jgi:hypothetical protein